MSASDQLGAGTLAYPIPVMKTIKRANLFFRDSWSRNTPEIGKSRMNTSETSAHAANGTDSVFPVLLRDVCELSSQVCPARGVAPIMLARMKAV